GLAAPFTPAGDKQYPNGSGLDDTFLRAGGAGRLFDVPQASLPATAVPHPYFRAELMRKIFNNVTTRSNVFAVWLTVGYFEVIDANSRPVKLGAEIGRSEGKEIRHRMFAIVDRSNLMWQPPAYTTALNSVQAQPNQTVSVGSLSLGKLNGFEWRIK